MRKFNTAPIDVDVSVVFTEEKLKSSSRLTRVVIELLIIVEKHWGSQETERGQYRCVRKMPSKSPNVLKKKKKKQTKRKMLCYIFKINFNNAISVLNKCPTSTTQFYNSLVFVIVVIIKRL